MPGIYGTTPGFDKQKRPNSKNGPIANFRAYPIF